METNEAKELLKTLKEIEGHLRIMANSVVTTHNNIEKPKQEETPQELPAPKKKFDIRSRADAFNKKIGQILSMGAEEKEKVGGKPLP